MLCELVCIGDLPRQNNTLNATIVDSLEIERLTTSDTGNWQL